MLAEMYGTQSFQGMQVARHGDRSAACYPVFCLLLFTQVAVPDSVTGLVWAGSSLLCAVPDGYYVLRPIGHSTAQHGLSSPTASAAAGTAGGMQYQLTLLADHLVSTRTMLGSVPDLGLGLVAWEDNMVLVTDAAGRRRCGALKAVLVALWIWLSAAWGKDVRLACDKLGAVCCHFAACGTVFRRFSPECPDVCCVPLCRCCCAGTPAASPAALGAVFSRPLCRCHLRRWRVRI